MMNTGKQAWYASVTSSTLSMDRVVVLRDLVYESDPHEQSTEQEILLSHLAAPAYLAVCSRDDFRSIRSLLSNSSTSRLQSAKVDNLHPIFSSDLHHPAYIPEVYRLPFPDASTKGLLYSNT